MRAISPGPVLPVAGSGRPDQCYGQEFDHFVAAAGHFAQFTVAAYPTQTFRATVTTIDMIGQSTSNVVSYTVQLTVDQQSLNGKHLYPGMTATVNITTAERIGVLVIPSAALSFPSTA